MSERLYEYNSDRSQQAYQWGCDRRVIAINALFALPVYSRLRHGRVPVSDTKVDVIDEPTRN
jgi:hypothetical protein